jgi:ribonucleoside-diphosphate reductase alpha chain
MIEVIRLHRKEAETIQPSHEFDYLKQEARHCWEQAERHGVEHGYRNAQVTVLAPTGTIAFLMDCDTTGIEPDIALVKYKLLAGGGMLKIVNRTVPQALKRLGYTQTEMDRIIGHIEKHDTIEHVTQNGKVIESGLHPEHLNVFDCAFKPHQGLRSIHYMAHLKMMGAAQPFISGAISKTVNLPNECSVEDIKDAYVQAWKMGLKCVAIYRDGSKRSQPLNTNQSSTESESESVEDKIASLEKEIERLGKQVTQPLRRRLPETRKAVTHKFDIAGHEGYLTVGLFEDDSPGELFITMAKEGSTIGGLMDSVATLTSMALQYGVPLDALVKKFSHQRFEPSGFTKNPNIRNCSSIPDYVFRWMSQTFAPGKSETAEPADPQPELKIPGLEEAEKKSVNRPIAELPLSEEASRPAPTLEINAGGENGPSVQAERGATSIEGQSFVNQSDAPACPNCGHVTVRNGACYKCLNCGESLGCS